MITANTVLILGAGASLPYGFPTGAGLADMVCARLRERDQNTDFKVSLRTAGVEDGAISRFVEAFRDSACPTLDEFVQSPGNRWFLPLVKASIIELLVARELPIKLSPDLAEHRNPKTRDLPPTDWYSYLFSHLRTPDEASFSGNRLKVITFNFDRSFEYSLFRMLRGSYGINDDLAGRLSALVPVLHVHGDLGGPYWLSERRQDSRDYSPTANADQKRALMDKIRIIHEDGPDDAFDQACTWMRAAEHIIFIGFGFHPINLKRLRMERVYTGKVWGTTLGLSAPELERVRGAIENRHSNLALDASRELDALRYLREVHVLHTDRG